MAAGDYVIRRNGSNTDEVPATGSDLLLDWPTAVANVGSGITHSSGTFTLGETGHFLVMCSEHFASADNTNNERIGGKMTLNLAGTELVEGYSSSYIRKNDVELLDWIHFSAAIINVTTTTGNGDDLQVRCERIDDVVLTGPVRVVDDRSGITIIKLDDSWDYGRYRSSSATATSGTDNARTVMNIQTQDEEDATFTRSTNVVDIATNDLVLAVYSVKSEDAGVSGRSEFQSNLELAGTVVPGSWNHQYIRNNQNTNWGGSSSVVLLEPTSGDNIDVGVISRENGGEEFEVALQLVKLPAGAEACIVEATTGNYNVAATNFAWDTNPYIDTAAFTHTTTQSNIDVDNDGDYIVMAAMGDSTDAGTAATRAQPAMQFRVNTTDIEHAGCTSYHRNNGTADHSSLACATLLDGLSANDSIHCRLDHFHTGMTTTVNNNSGQFAAIRMDSLFGGDTEITTNLETLSLATFAAGIVRDHDIQAGTAALTVATFGADVHLNMNIDANTAGLTLNTFAAGIERNHDIQAGTAALTVTTNAATVSVDHDIQATTPALSIATFAATITSDTQVDASTAALTLTTYPATALQAPRVYLNTIEDLAGATEMTVASYNEAGTSITFDDAEGAPTGALFLGVQNVRSGLVDWIGVTVAAAGTVISATTASLTLATFASTITRNHDIQATTAALNLTTQAATVDVAFNIAASTAALTVNTFAADIIVDHDIQATTAALTVTTFKTGAEIDTHLAPLTLTTFPASVDAGRNVLATTAALDLATAAATITRDHDIQATVAALNLTTFAASLTEDVNVAATTASLTVNTFAASIVVDHDIAATTASLTLTPQQASIVRDHDIGATTQALTLTTFPATIANDVDVGAATASLTLTTFVADIVRNHNIQATTRALNLTTFPADLSEDRNIAATTASLDLQTHAATISVDHDIQASTASLTVTTFAATISEDTTVEAGTATLTLVANNATITVDHDIQASTANLTLVVNNATISTGEEEEDAPTGGYGALNYYSSYLQRKKRRERERKKLMLEVNKLHGTDLEIAKLLHKKLEWEARDKEIAELEELVQEADVNRGRDDLAEISEDIANAFTRAYMQGNFSAFEAFEREMETYMEEEDFMMLAMVMLQ